ncbi:MAG: 4Fe-4S dicluster domain-containing protein [Halanaerobiales bacterium]
MSIKINKELCHGCPHRKEGRCERICPGNLISRKNGKAEIEHPQDCWDCAACIKSCPANAISLYLPEEIGGKGAELSAQLKNDEIIWIFRKVKGGEKKYRKSLTVEVNNKENINTQETKKRKVK